MEKTVDLSHTLHEGMPVYPGTESPVFINACKLEVDGFAELKLSFFSHTGTHIDSPAHILKGEKSISDLNIDQFIGKAIVLPHVEGQSLTVQNIKEAIKELGNPDFILIQTSWDQYWGADQYYNSCSLPDYEIFQFLASLKLKGLGIDAISIDAVGSVNFPNHKVILGSGAIIIENLTGLDQLREKYFDFYCFPLKIEYGDGSPIRAVAKYT